MKRYIKSSATNNSTIREYVATHRDALANADILIVCLEPYDPKYPDDVPGVLFDGSYTDLMNTRENIEDNIGDNYLSQEDLDELQISKVENTPDDVTIYLEAYW